MKKIISNSKIIFCNEVDNELMYIDYSFDECIWCFNTSQKIIIEQDSELYSLLNDFMYNNYSFGENELGDYKSIDELVWHSDCYYNPDDELSIKNVSILFIKKVNNIYEVWCENLLIKCLIK